jgi:hypothetical protein
MQSVSQTLESLPRMLEREGPIDYWHNLRGGYGANEAFQVCPIAYSDASHYGATASKASEIYPVIIPGQIADEDNLAASGDSFKKIGKRPDTANF